MKEIDDLGAWIAPLEFHYCARCGRYLVEKDAEVGKPVPLCEVCNMYMSVGETSIFEARAKREAKHKLLNDERLKLGRERRDAGVPKLWWLLPKYNYVRGPRGDIVKVGIKPESDGFVLKGLRKCLKLLRGWFA